MTSDPELKDKYTAWISAGIYISFALSWIALLTAIYIVW